MRRLSGEALKTGAEERAGESLTASDIVTAIAALGGAGALGVTGLTSLYDLFTGESRLDNSGEYLANAGIQLIPISTAAIGAGLVKASDPVAKDLIGLVTNHQAARDVGRDLGAALVDSKLTETPLPSASAVETSASNVEAAKQRLIQSTLEKIRSDAELSRMKPAQAAKAVIQRSGRNLMRATGAGAILGSIPAVLMMQDSPTENSDKQR